MIKEKYRVVGIEEIHHKGNVWHERVLNEVVTDLYLELYKSCTFTCHSKVYGDFTLRTTAVSSINENGKFLCINTINTTYKLEKIEA